MNDEMEGLQATVYQLQQNLKETQEQLHEAQEENKRLRTTLPSGTNVPVEGSGGNSQAALQGVVVEATKTELSSKDTSTVKRTLSSSTNARAKSRHLEKKDTVSERTICKTYKTSGQNRTKSSSGNHERTAAATTTQSSDKTSRVRQTDVSDSKMTGAGGNATLSTHPEESSNGNRNSEKLESVASEMHDNSIEKSRSSNERENQKQRTGVSSSKLDGATNELANGLVSKHNTLPDTCQKT